MPNLTSSGAALRRETLPWIVRAGPDIPYFCTETGEPWTPIGQNDAISWDEFAGLFRRRDLAGVARHLRWLRENGVTCLRLMLEYAQVRHRYFENPVGRFVPAMVRLWDDLFALCEQVGMRILLTPFDTFWTWLHWRHHPYNAANGGVLDHPARLLLDMRVREAIKARLTFAAERWGGSGALFAWDLWNEIHPAQAQDSADVFVPFIADLSQHVRELERRLFGRTHLQTVSLFGPELVLQPHLPMRDPIFRHPDLDIASIHIYEEGTIDHPRDTVAPAIGMGRIVRECLSEIADNRPFFDSEHGPIHTFKDHKRTLPEPFDDEYFRHLQWVHLASGGAGGGNAMAQSPPASTDGRHARRAKSLAGFLPLIDWTTFRRRNLNEEASIDHPACVLFACGDARQAVAWCLRRNAIAADGRVDPDAPPIDARLTIPGLEVRAYRVHFWDTKEGRSIAEARLDCSGTLTIALPPLATDVAVAIRAEGVR